MIKVAPPSADLLIKLAVGLVVIGGVAYVVNRGAKSVQSAVDSITSLPSRAWSGLTSYAQLSGGAFQDQYSINPAPTIANGSGYGGKYNGPLVNDAGMDFGALSG